MRCNPNYALGLSTNALSAIINARFVINKKEKDFEALRR
jgi:hypothetical protein